jgi:hypothetical protein
VTEPPDKLTPATTEDLEQSLAFALRYSGRKRIHDADVFMSELVAKRLARLQEAADNRTFVAFEAAVRALADGRQVDTTVRGGRRADAVNECRIPRNRMLVKRKRVRTGLTWHRP